MGTQDPQYKAPKRFHEIEINRVVFDADSLEESEDVLATKIGFNNLTYDLLFSELGYSPQEHAEARARFGKLIAQLADGKATDEERKELAAFDVVDLYGSDRGQSRVATDLIYVGLKAANPGITRDEVASWLTNKETVRVLQQAVVPAVFAFFGSDYGMAVAEANRKAEQMLTDAIKSATTDSSKDAPGNA